MFREFIEPAAGRIFEKKIVILINFYYFWILEGILGANGGYLEGTLESALQLEAGRQVGKSVYNVLMYIVYSIMYKMF